jgi:phospholipase C
MISSLQEGLSMTVRLRAAAAAALLAAAGCGGAGTPHGDALPPAAAVSQPLSVPASSYIKHVVIIVQENRSFENIFAGWPGADAPMTGKATTPTGVKTLRLKPIGFVKGSLGHLWSDGIHNWDNGKMDGFENNHLPHGLPAGTYAYQYLSHDLIRPYRAMASQYVLADRMFPSMFGASFTAHLTLISSMTNETPSKAIVDVPTGTPWGCDAPVGTETSTVDMQRVVVPRTGGFPCFTQFGTMADTLDEKGVSWKYYAPNILKYAAWSAFDAIKSVRYGPDWSKVATPEWQVLLDAKNGALPAVSWVTPDAQDSDHPGDGSDTGPSWVGTVVNAIGNSSYWDSTAIFVVWDDWGGWYDNVPPPQLDFKGLGIRVPCIVISPYAKKGYVDHTQYEFGSMLHFTEQVFGLRALGPASAGYTDQRANTMLNAFDFTQKPRPFVHIPTPYPKSFFMNHPQSMRAPDDD